MDNKIIIYTEKDALEEIIIFDETYPNWNEILKHHSSICVNMTDDELEAIWNEDNDIFSFCQGHDIPMPIALAPYFKSIEEEYSIIEEKPRSVFILNTNLDVAERLRNEYGIIVLSKEKIDDSIFTLRFFKNLDNNDVIEGKGSGWQNLIGDCKLPPSNSLVISDNYLFKNIDTKSNIYFGSDNLINMFDTILPYKLSIPFHILILSNYPKDCDDKKCNSLIGMLKTNISKLRPYDINLEFVFTDTEHKRIMFSNYYEMSCDKGFALFDISNNKLIRGGNNDCNLQSIFHDVRNTKGDTSFVTTSKKLKEFKQISKTLAEQINAEIKDHTKKIAGDCKKDKSINNRLIQSI